MTAYSQGSQAAELLNRIIPLPVGAYKTNKPSPEWELALSISGKLQTTLDLHSILELFSQEVDSLIKHAGLTYRFEQSNDGIQIRKTAAHSLNYHLKLFDHGLGDVSVYRKRRFNKKEIEQFENLLTVLLYPLRNALLYYQAVQSAFHDALTGVKNRAAFDSTLQRDIAISRRNESPLSLLVIDIDLFKRINDQFGHSIGDVALKQVARTIESTIRESDALYRYGGEEFVVVLNDTHSDGALLLAERIRKNIENMSIDQTRSIALTVRLGLSVLNDEDGASSLFERADQALYQAKQAGRNRTAYID